MGCCKSTQRRKRGEEGEFVQLQRISAPINTGNRVEISGDSGEFIPVGAPTISGHRLVFKKPADLYGQVTTTFGVTSEDAGSSSAQQKQQDFDVAHPGGAASTEKSVSAVSQQELKVDDSVSAMSGASGNAAGPSTKTN
ncbi:hypothetical protein FSARC_8181 [Fusarium sarcochroum]|uniref:Uncharacterized protein n=1 Tax=Fusarium sarcochroum TaxID=1208366 RepID=A0A8H4TTL6_9HYPO|nr:hypothetical protein FSARC_8181 [Fusarium sarcochroum]